MVIGGFRWSLRRRASTKREPREPGFGGLAVWRFGGLAVWRFGGLVVLWFGLDQETVTDTLSHPSAESIPSP